MVVGKNIHLGSDEPGSQLLTRRLCMDHTEIIQGPWQRAARLYIRSVDHRSYGIRLHPQTSKTRLGALIETPLS